MTAEELIAAGWELSRPSLCLRARRGTEPVVGLWGGEGVVPLPASTAASAHWVSIDCGWLSRNGFNLTGVLSLYEVGTTGFVAVSDPGMALPDGRADALALAGEEVPSFPPAEALDLYGSDAARTWLNLPRRPEDAVVGNAYDREYQKHLPLYRDQVAAVLGGWHLTWPDSDGYDEVPGRLALWTLKDSEPWVEVWVDESGALKAIPRIT